MLILFDTAAALWPWNFKLLSTIKTPAEEFIRILPDDLLIEILIRVPDSRSAINCGAVCKRWNNLTAKNPLFVPTFIRHRQRFFSFFLQKGPLLCNMGYREFLLSSEKPDHVVIKKLPHNFIDFVTGRIRASFNDLLLVSTFNDMSRYYFIFNLITGWWVRLPPAPISGIQVIPFHGLVCKKLGPSDILYRVVLFYSDNHSQIRVSVFSSETNEWTTSTIEYQLDPIGSHPVRHNNSVVARGGILYLNHPLGRGCVLSFDPFGQPSENQMNCRFVALPEKITNDRVMISRFSVYYGMELCLGVCRDRVRVCRLFYGRPHYRWLGLEVWELNEDESSWSFVHGVELCVGPFAHMLRMAKFHPNDPDVVFLIDKSSVYRCDFPEKKLVKVVNVPIQYSDDLNFRELTMFSIVEPYWPTPVPTLPGLL